MFETLLIIVVAIHLLAVNLAAGGPLIAPWVEWYGTRCGRAAFQEAALGLARWSIGSAAVGVGLGFIALAALTVWHPGDNSHYGTALRQVRPGRWWFAGVEIAFYFGCMAAYVLLWRRLERYRLVHRALALAAGTNLMYHFPALFTILSVITDRPRLWDQPLDRRLYLQLLFDGQTLARVSHVWLASLAIAGLALSWVSLRGGRHRDPSDANRAATVGGRISLAATLLQVPVGVWVLMTLPESQQQRAMGGDVICTMFFGISVFVALALMHQLAMISLGDVARKRIRLAAALMALVVLLMTATLHLARG